jgi:alkylation response protein AidB-like acyl-CoA dehydrogenase
MRSLSELAAEVEQSGAAGRPALSSLFSQGVVGAILNRHGSPEQRRRWLEPIERGEVQASFAITESDAGTNSHRIKTRAVRDNGGYRLRGQKVFTSGIEHSDIVVVVARTERGLSLFIVDADTVERAEIPTALQMDDRQWTLFFDDVYVDAERLVGSEGDGLKVAFCGMNVERVLTAAVCIGIGLHALAQVTAVSGQAAAHGLAEARIALTGAQLMTRRAAQLYDAGLDRGGEAANMAKLLGSDAGAVALSRAIDVCGFDRLAPYWWTVRTLQIGPVSREMILNFVAERSLGLPRSY